MTCHTSKLFPHSVIFFDDARKNGIKNTVATSGIQTKWLIKRTGRVFIKFSVMTLGLSNSLMKIVYSLNSRRSENA
jgi:hypothetical protein